MKTMNRYAVTLTTMALVIALFSCLPNPASAGEKVHLDILYMNHGPMRPTISKIKQLLAGFEDRVKVAWYDFEQPAGQAYMERNNIVGHIPILIKIDGQSRFGIGGREIQLQGFPSGAGPFKQVEGNWSLDDLQLLLERSVR